MRSRTYINPINLKVLGIWIDLYFYDISDECFGVKVDVKKIKFRGNWTRKTLVGQTYLQFNLKFHTSKNYWNFLKNKAYFAQKVVSIKNLPMSVDESFQKSLLR